MIRSNNENTTGNPISHRRTDCRVDDRAFRYQHRFDQFAYDICREAFGKTWRVQGHLAGGPATDSGSDEKAVGSEESVDYENAKAEEVAMDLDRLMDTCRRAVLQTWKETL